MSLVQNRLGLPELVWLFMFLSKTLNSICLVLRRALQAVGPVYMISDIDTVCTLKNITGYSKRAGDQPGTVDCASKTHSSILGSRVNNMYSLPVRSAIILKHMRNALIKEEEEKEEYALRL